MKQTEMILDYIKTHGSITDAEAMNLGVMRLGARIWDLINKHGVVIKSEWEAKKNRYGKVTTYKRYFLGDADE